MTVGDVAAAELVWDGRVWPGWWLVWSQNLDRFRCLLAHIRECHQ
jgi:hypothetical protein